MNLPIYEEPFGEYTFSTDKRRLDISVIHTFLSTQAYWSPGISLETVRQAMANSLCFGIYHCGQQVGYARIISDLTTFAYLCDVFILEEFRGRGLSKHLLEFILSHPQLQNLRRWMLATRDAHSLYARFGFQTLQRPERFMEYFPSQ